MATRRCPHCGSPAVVRGNRWECGWCGDFGMLSSLYSSENVLTEAEPAEGISTLEQGIFSVLEGMREVCDSVPSANESTWQLTAYAISHALHPVKNQNSHNLRALEDLCRLYPIFSADEILCAAQAVTPAYHDLFALSPTYLGTFWEALLPQFPRSGDCKSWPNWIHKLIDGLEQIERFFTAEANLAYFQILYAHWCAYSSHSTDRTALEDIVQKWNLSQNKGTCRDLLIAAFPEASDLLTPETLKQMRTADLLARIGEDAPETAIQMITYLLNLAEKHLQKPEVAAQLLGTDLHALCRIPHALPLLIEQLKQDDHLARQIFQSAYIGETQQIILDACAWFDELELQQDLQVLLNVNHFSQ